MSTVFIISAPSGSGKSTLVNGLLQCDPDLIFSVSYTTRERRGSERPGESYNFIDRKEFENRVQLGEFLEWADVFGNYYGTHRSVLERAELEGKDLVLDIDIQGARQLRKSIPGAVSIFVLAPSRQILENRLRNRSEDAEEVIQRRLRKASDEIRNYSDYDYVLVNDDLAKSRETLYSIVRAERARRQRVEKLVRSILSTFD